jgi:hypothetical protein
MKKISYIDMKAKDLYMNYAEQKKLTAAANKLLRGSGKKNSKSKMVMLFRNFPKPSSKQLQN